MFFGVVTCKGRKKKFKGFIEGDTPKECREKIINMNRLNKSKLKLYGYPFSKMGNVINYKRYAR